MKINLITLNFICFLLAGHNMALAEENKEQVPDKPIKVAMKIEPILSWHQNEALLKLKEKRVPEKRSMLVDFRKNNPN